MLNKLEEIHNRLTDLLTDHSKLLENNTYATTLMSSLAAFLRTGSTNNPGYYQVIRSGGDWLIHNTYESAPILVDNQTEIDLFDAAQASILEKYGNLEEEITLASESIRQEREAMRIEYSGIYPKLETEEDKQKATNLLRD